MLDLLNGAESERVERLLRPSGSAANTKGRYDYRPRFICPVWYRRDYARRLLQEGQIDNYNVGEAALPDNNFHR